jgi:hypothetical protein
MSGRASNKTSASVTLTASMRRNPASVSTSVPRFVLNDEDDNCLEWFHNPASRMRGETPDPQTLIGSLRVER